MRNFFGSAVLAAVIGLVGAPAHAVQVSYTLTFTGANSSDDGTGTLVLNLPSLPDNNPISFTSLPNSIFSSLTATIGSQSFTLTDTNISFGGVQGTSGSSIDIAMTESTSGLATGATYLEIDNGSTNAGTFQFHEVNQGGTFPSGSYTIGSPFVAAVPEASTWAMLIFGFLATGFLAYRKTSRLR